MTRHLIGAAVAAALLAGCATAPDPGAARAEIEAAEAAWSQALIAKDAAALERLLAPEFRLEGAHSAEATPRDRWLANLGRMDIRSYVTRVTAVRVDGDTAVADVSGDWSIARGGQTLTDAFVLQDTWVKRDGQWRVARRYRLNKGPGD
ncbi:MAG TPA: nuclear transport factor 2 family protein [Caulobacteraceae bacterium]|jgi:hypothetical protein